MADKIAPIVTADSVLTLSKKQTRIGFGYRQRITALVSALLVSHLAIVMNVYTDSGRVNLMFIRVYFLIFFGFYAETDRLTLDTVRRSISDNLYELNDKLRSSRPQTSIRTSSRDGNLT